MKKQKFLTIAGLFFLCTFNLSAQSVTFPDDVRERGYYDRPYKRYEAEQGKCVTNGAILNSTFDQREIQSEASNQSAVQLTAQGSYVQWTNDEAADGLTIRFSIPDNATGTGTTGTVAFYVDDVFVQDIELNSYWAWQYVLKNGQKYPYNTPGIDKFPRMRFDEIRVKLTEKIPAGATFRIEKADNKAAAYTIDFVELEPIPFKVEKPDGAVEYSGNGSDLVAFVANNAEKTIYIPEGKYDVPTRLYINGNGTKLIGAGMWYTQLHFIANPANTINNPSNPNGYNARGIQSDASDVEVSGLYLTTVNERRYQNYSDTKKVGEGFSGSFGTNSRVRDVWVTHFECGAWIEQSNELQFSHCRFRNNYADGTNFSYGSQNCSVTHSSYRNNGDDDMASWSRGNLECYNNLFEKNTSENCWRAAGIGFFGGKQHKARRCVIIDPVEVGIRVNSDFSGKPFSDEGEFELSDISVYRAGTKSGGGTPGIIGDLWGWSAGALYLRSNNQYDVKNIRFTNIDIYDSKGDAVVFQSDSKVFTNINIESITINRVNISDVGTDNAFGMNFMNAKGSGNTFCINYMNVPENRKKNLTIPPTGFTEQTDCPLPETVPLTGLYISPDNFVIKVGEKINPALAIHFSPVNTTEDKTLLFRVIDGEEYASVTEQGIITGATEGVAIIRVSLATNEEIYADLKITVEGYAVLGVTLDTLKLTLTVGETYQLTPIFTPSNVSNKNVTWSGSSVRASVDANGLVTALQASATAVTNIRVTTQEGNYTAACVVTVVKPTPIITPETEELQITACGDLIQISGHADGEMVAVYSLLGTKIFSQKLDRGAKAIRGLRDGVYIVVAEKAGIMAKVITTK